MGLFQLGQFKLHSGETSTFKIDCDHLSDSDLGGLCSVIYELVGPFKRAIGVPTGGLRLAEMLNLSLPLNALDDNGRLPTLIVDDVLTTGNSMEEVLDSLGLRSEPHVGVVIFARRPPPKWIIPIFQMATPESSDQIR